jgi:hypothetical protein
MNERRTPFTPFSVNHPSAALIKRRLLFLVCLLLFVQGTSSAQEMTSGTQAPSPARAGASGTGAITGRVISEDGRPLADAVIFLNRAFARVPGPPLTATTDAEGRFRVSGLEAGLYMANAMLPGFTVPDAATSEGEMNYYRIGDSINLTLVKGGVITGTVRDANGEPVVAVAVRAARVRDTMGRAQGPRSTGFYPERMTDDRGVYRIYGLPAGTYMVSAGGSNRMMLTNAYEGDVQTFFPSSTRDTAAEVAVRSGEETAGIDIRYRGERGHTISGKVSGFIDTKTPSPASVLLRLLPGGGYEGATFAMMGSKPGFSFNGVSDGEYEVAAQQWGGINQSAVSLPRRITIKGADVTGIELVLSPLASIAGRVQLDAAAPPAKENCVDGRGGTLIETAIQARRDEKSQREDSMRLPFFSMAGGVPTEQGEFTIHNLIAGNYRLNVRLPNEAWYVRSIVLPSTTASPATAPAAKSAQPVKSSPSSNLIALTTGARVTNVNVQIAQDAAGLRGRIASATEGAEGTSLPPNLKVYLVPIERERAEDTLRYSEAQLASDGTFTLQNLAPGRYWLIARPAPENESPERTSRPLAWDADKRVKLRQEAEAAKITIELQPCQRVLDYVLRYATDK